MDVNRTGALDWELVGGVRQGGLGEQRIRDKIPIGSERINDELILPFDRDKDQRLCRMNVEMARAEAIAAVRRHLALVRQHAVAEAVNVERTRILRLVAVR